MTEAAKEPFNAIRLRKMSALGERITARAEQNDIDALSAQLAARENITPEIALQYIMKLQQNMERYLFHDDPQTQHIDGGQPGRLARLLKLMNVAPDDEIIQAIKEYEPGFIYPFNMEKISGGLQARLDELG